MGATYHMLDGAIVLGGNGATDKFYMYSHKYTGETIVDEKACRKLWPTFSPAERKQITEFIKANSTGKNMEGKPLPVHGIMKWAFVKAKNLDTGKQFNTVAWRLGSKFQGISANQMRAIVGLRPVPQEPFKPGRREFSLGEVPKHVKHVPVVAGGRVSRLPVSGGKPVRPVLAVAKPKVDISKLTSRSAAVSAKAIKAVANHNRGAGANRQGVRGTGAAAATKRPVRPKGKPIKKGGGK